MLFKVILIFLSKESRENLENQGVTLFTETYRQPLFDYIRFWMYLDFGDFYKEWY